MRWLYQQGIGYVSTSTNSDHIVDNLLALDNDAMSPLSKEEIETIKNDQEVEHGQPRPCQVGF